jgi:hypothetical protein
MAQKPILRAEVYARALRASQSAKRAEVLVRARCALRVGGAWGVGEYESGRHSYGVCGVISEVAIARIS